MKNHSPGYRRHQELHRARVDSISAATGERTDAPRNSIGLRTWDPVLTAGANSPPSGARPATSNALVEMLGCCSGGHAENLSKLRFSCALAAGRMNALQKDRVLPNAPPGFAMRLFTRFAGEIRRRFVDYSAC